MLEVDIDETTAFACHYTSLVPMQQTIPRKVERHRRVTEAKKCRAIPDQKKKRDERKICVDYRIDTQYLRCRICENNSVLTLVVVPKDPRAWKAVDKSAAAW